MFANVLPIHKFLRWVILCLAFGIVFRSYYGWLKKESWGRREKIVTLVFTIMLDLQLVSGLFLLVSQDWSTWGRFLMEHILPMIIAVGLAHVGKVLSGKGKESIEKYRSAALWYSIVLLIILLAIPWNRPLWFSY